MTDSRSIESLFDPREVEMVVDSLKLEYGESFGCYGRKYSMWFRSFSDMGDEPACFWELSTARPGSIDVYLIDEIPDDFKRAILVHEIVEAAARPVIGDMFKAHLLARDYDTAYAKSHFDEKRLEEFFNLDKYLVELEG